MNMVASLNDAFIYTSEMYLLYFLFLTVSGLTCAFKVTNISLDSHFLHRMTLLQFWEGGELRVGID